MAIVDVRRGEVYLLDTTPYGGRLSKRRPVLVVQNDIGNRFSPTLIVAAITEYSKAKAGFPVSVTVLAGEAGLEKDSLVNTAQVRTIDRCRVIGRPLGRLSVDTVERLDGALRLSLALP